LRDVFLRPVVPYDVLPWVSHGYHNMPFCSVHLLSRRRPTISTKRSVTRCLRCGTFRPLRPPSVSAPSLSTTGQVSVSEPAPVPATTMDFFLTSWIVLKGVAPQGMQRPTSLVTAPIQVKWLMS